MRAVRLMDQGIHFSQGFDLTFNYEETFLATMVARGFAVVVADGVGMGVHIPGGPSSPIGFLLEPDCSTPPARPCSCRAQRWIPMGRWPSGAG